MQAWRAIGLALALLWPLPVFAEEPAGFLDRPWGARWTGDAISALPGCEDQGETIADVEGFIVRVAQPECLGYRFAEGLTVNLYLLYPDIGRRSLDGSRVTVRSLLDHRRMWGLDLYAVEMLERWDAELRRRHDLRARHGACEPVLRGMAHGTLDLPAEARGLQGYQLSFSRTQYDAMRVALLQRLGPPRREGEGEYTEGLEWRGERTIARLMPDYFVVVTRAYAALLDALPIPPRAEPPALASYPWYLQLVEGFAWARNSGFRGPGSDRINP
jgi:hypothetical protein